MIRLQDLPTGLAGWTQRSSHGSDVSIDTLRHLAERVFCGGGARAYRPSTQNTDGNKVQAAALLRISRKKLYAKIEKYGI